MNKDTHNFEAKVLTVSWRDKFSPSTAIRDAQLHCWIKLRRMNTPKLIASICLAFLLLSQLHAAVIVDQQVDYSESSGSSFILRENGTAGQSFTPQLSSIDFITINNLGNSLSLGAIEATLRLGLYLGEDKSLGALASSPDIILRSRYEEISSEPFNLGYNIVDPLTWYFDMPVSVAPGSKYSFHVDHISGDDLDWLISLAPNNGGKAIFPIPEFGFVNETYIFSFTEEISVPEPSSLMLIFGSIFPILFLRK